MRTPLPTPEPPELGERNGLAYALFLPDEEPSAGIVIWWLLAPRGGAASGDWRSLRRHHYVGTYVYEEQHPIRWTVIEGPGGGREFHVRAYWTKVQFWNRANHLGDGWFAYSGSFNLAADGRVEGRASQHHSFTGRSSGVFPDARFDAVRPGGALYGLSPFNTDPTDDGLEPVLSWRTGLGQVKLLRPGESTGYGREYVPDRETWIGIVPVGYADGFRRALSGTEVLVDGDRRRVVGRVSMDAFAVELPGELRVGTPVTLLGDGLLIEEHARAAGTINYELACGIGIVARPERTQTLVRDA